MARKSKKERKYRYWVYKIIDTLNNKIYIGSSTRENPIDRWKEHLAASRLKSSLNKIYIDRAIKKYGEEYFTFQTIEELKSEEEMFNKEKFYIKKYGTKNKNIGYNITEGGKGAPGIKFKKSNKEKITMSERQKQNFMNGKLHPTIGKWKLSEIKRNEVCQKYKTGKYTHKQLAIEYDVSQSSIEHLLKVNNLQGIHNKAFISEEGLISRKQKNSRDGSMAKIKITSYQIQEAFQDYIDGKFTMNELANKYNLTLSYMQKLIGKYKKENPELKEINLYKIGHKKSLTDQQEQEIREKYSTKQFSVKELCNEYNVSLGPVLRCIEGIPGKNSKFTRISSNVRSEILEKCNELIIKFNITIRELANLLLNNKNYVDDEECV